MIGCGRDPDRWLAVVVDLCCGSGAIGAAVAHEHPGALVYAADVDPVAVACARRNLPPERVFEGDLYDALPADLAGQVDVLAVNAPYVPTDAIATMPGEARDHEPRVALDGGPDGVDLHRRVAEGASALARSRRAAADRDRPVAGAAHTWRPAQRPGWPPRSSSTTTSTPPSCVRSGLGDPPPVLAADP